MQLCQPPVYTRNRQFACAARRAAPRKEAAAGGERPTEATALADIEISNEITVSTLALRLAISLSVRKLLQNAECATDQKNKAANSS